MRVFLILCCIAQALAFAPVPHVSQSNNKAKDNMISMQIQMSSSSSNSSNSGLPMEIPAVVTGFATGAVALVQSVRADEIEYAELPPPYIPVIFGLALVVGVGLLTGSLGNVIDEEALLGMQSGARAKKEIERSRSSYFKKK